MNQIGVIGLKGGVGRTAVTAALGSIFSAVRRDRIPANDADPNGGNLVDRTAHRSPPTIEHLLGDPQLARYNDIRAYTQMNKAGLEVLAAPQHGGARHEFSADDWRGLTRIVAPYYNVILADAGKGRHNPAARAGLSTMSSLVIVCSATADGARSATMTMNWLGHNGYRHLARRSCVVITHLVGVKPQIDVMDLGHQYERVVGQGRVVLVPWDTHVATGGEIRLEPRLPAQDRRVGRGDVGSLRFVRRAARRRRPRHSAPNYQRPGFAGAVAPVQRHPKPNHH